MKLCLYKLFLITLAAGTVGAQIVCACPGLATIREAPKAMNVACVGERECCRKTEARAKVTPVKQEPCQKCNLKHRMQQALPDEQSTASMSNPILAALPAQVDIAAIADPGGGGERMAEAIGPPEMLRDLFHVHSLLLN